MAQLRTHPVLNNGGIPNWPPLWLRPHPPPPKVLEGEVGTLRDVQSHEPDQCFLTMEFDKEFYIGALVVREAAFCRQIYELLRAHLGKPIKEIGDLDIE